MDQLERGDVVLDALDKYRVVEMSRPYFAVDSDNPNHAWIQGDPYNYGGRKRLQEIFTI